MAAHGVTWTSRTVGVAVINENADPKEAAFFAISLQHAALLESVRALLVEPKIADECARSFAHRVVLKSQKDSAQAESIYTAEITPFSSEKSLLTRVGAGCGEVYMLAHDVAIALNFSNRTASSCRAPGPDLCGPWLQNEEAYSLYREHRFQEAVVSYEQLVLQFPSFAWARHNFGMAQLAACQDPAVAVEELRAAVTLADGSCGWFWYDLALACRLTKDYVCAMESAKQSLQHDPGYVDAYNAMGVILMETGRLEESERMFDAYATHLDDQGNVRQQIALEKNRGILAYHQGRYEAAIQRLDAARGRVQLRRIFNQDVSHFEEEIVFYLGRSYEATGDDSKACELYRQYEVMPQACNFGEAERRSYVVSQVTSTFCSQP